MRERFQAGAPGVYLVPEEPLRALTGVRMDVAAFVGVAPRGPSRLPVFPARWAEPPRGPAAPLEPLRSVAVPVESWDAYRRLFGGFEGPGLLPYAVAAFFEQGGRRAYVVRVVHDYGAGDPRNGFGVATGLVPGVAASGGAPPALRARSEGSWGNRLRAALSFRTRPLHFDRAKSTLGAIAVTPDNPLPAGTLLRLWLPGGIPVLRFVTDVRDAWNPELPVKVRRGTLETAVDELPDRAEVVEGVLEVDDGAGDGVVRGELHEGLGLSALHPRWMAAVLYLDSELVYPDPSWIHDDLRVDDPYLDTPPPGRPPQFTCGRDRYAEILHDDFFDWEWVLGDDRPGSGIHALAELEDLSLVVVPDLYSPKPLVERVVLEDTGSTAGPRFQACVEPAVESLPPYPELLCADGYPPEPDGSEQGLDGLRLLPDLPGDLEEIVRRQQQVVALAELLEWWIVLLDVPPGLTQREVLDWRARFGTAWAAGYHPWLRVSRPDDAREPLVEAPPSAFAAGIVARQENAFGVQHGPANVLVTGAVSVTDRVSPLRHDELHQGAVNVFLPERDGIRLTAGRTLSRDPIWRQLSVRRLVTMIKRVLLRQMQWTVFEPNDGRLRDELRRMLETYLRQLFRASAFRGRTPGESFFVRCDQELNPQPVVDAGRLVCHVGIAPVEPLEFIVLRLSREGDGTLLMEE